MSDPFIAVDEWVVEDQGKAESGSFTYDTQDRGLALQSFGVVELKQTPERQDSNPSGTTPPFDHGPV